MNPDYRGACDRLPETIGLMIRELGVLTAIVGTYLLAMAALYVWTQPCHGC